MNCGCRRADGGRSHYHGYQRSGYASDDFSKEVHQRRFGAAAAAQCSAHAAARIIVIVCLMITTLPPPTHNR